MRKFRKGLSGLLAFVMALSAMVCNMAVTASAEPAHTVWIVGDSTGCHYADTADPSHKYKRVGFGDMIQNYLTADYKVENLALSGRSSRSFKSEKNYTEKLQGMQSGDILIIAFGHNDEKSGTQDPNGNLHTTVGNSQDDESGIPGSFQNSLKDYLDLAQKKGATPILCSPIVRLPANGLEFSAKDKHDLGSGANYAEAVKTLATNKGVAFVDLTALTEEEYNTLKTDITVGSEPDKKTYKKYLFCHAWAGEDTTTIDHTHLSKYGADLVAYLLANSANNSGKVNGVFDSGKIVKPTLDEAYINGMLNPNYVAPTDKELTAEDLSGESGSKLWTGLPSGWFGSAFGDIGGNPSKEKFTIEKVSDDKIHVAAVNSSGKLSATKTGMAMYFMPIPAAGNFMISANAHINSIGTSDSQGGFGAIITDKILVDTRDSSFNTSYAAATPYDLATGAPTAGLALKDTTFVKGESLPMLPEAGDDVKVTVIKIGDKYTTSYKTPYGTFVKTFDLTGYMEGTLYAGLFAARNADITFSDISTTNEVIEKDDPIEYVNGNVKYTNNNTDLGTVTITGNGVNLSGDSADQNVDGGTELTIKAVPNEASNTRASIKVKVGEGTRELVGDSYTWKVDGDIEFVVDFVSTNPMTAINSTNVKDANLDMTTDEGLVKAQTQVQQYNKFLEGNYYYRLTANTTFDTAKKRISLGKGDSTKSSIIFKTDADNLSLKVHFASGNEEQERGTALGIVDVEDKTTTVLGTATTATYTVPYKLEADKEYYITSTGSTIYIDKIEFETVNYIEVTPSFTCDEADPNEITEGTYKIDGYGTLTAIGQSISLPAGTYDVTVTDSEGVKYTGELTVNDGESQQTIPVTLKKADVSNIDYWFDEQASVDEGTYVAKKGSTAFPGGTVTLYDDFERAQSYTYNTHTSYQGIDSSGVNKGKALDASGTAIGAGKAIVPVSGNAYSFKPNADGTVRFYGATSAGKSYSILPVNSTGSIQEVITVADAVASKPYTMSVKSDWTYYVFGNGSTGASAFLGFEYVVDKTVTVSGTISRAEGVDTSIPLPAKIVFTPENDSDPITTTINGDSGAYTVNNIKAGIGYTITAPSEELMFAEVVKAVFTENTSDFNLEMVKIEGLPVKGTVTIQGDSSKLKDNLEKTINIKYTNIADESKTATITNASLKDDNSYEVSLDPGTYKVDVTEIDGYEVSSLSKDEFTVSYNNKEDNFNNILYKKKPTEATQRQITVDSSVTSYDGTTYPTINEALAGMRLAKNSGKVTVSAEEPWEVTIKNSGKPYQEQVIVDLPYVHFKGESADNKPTITWYYGVGYKYYSIKPNASDSVSYDRGYYDIEYAYDQHSKATADRWGTTVRVTGTDFYAENIIFEASFNRKYDEEKEKADGVEPAMESEYGGSGNVVKLPERTANNFADTAATERAAAMVLDNAQAEFYNCSFLSSQDTLYMGTGGTFYFNKCTVMGETDYIFGDISTGVFDDCELAWAGYTGTSKEGYITASRGNMLFRNCKITSDNEKKVKGATVKAGYLGRHWDTTNNVNVIFADTQGVNDSSLIVQNGNAKSLHGYMNPSSLTKTDATLVKEFYCTTDKNGNYTQGENGKYDEPTSITNQKCTKDGEELELADIQGFTYLGSWEPTHYAFNPSENAPAVYGFNLNSEDNVLSATQTKDITSNKGDASITLGGATTYHSETYGIMVFAGASIKFTVDDSADQKAENVDLKFDFKTTSNNAAITITDLTDDSQVNSEDKDIVHGSHTTVSFKAKPGHSYAITFGAIGQYTSFYMTGFNITATPSTTDIKAYESNENTYEFSYNNGTDGNGQPNEALDSPLKAKDGDAVLEIENVYNHKIQYGGVVKAGSSASFTMATEAKKTSVVISSSFGNNTGTVDVLVNGEVRESNVDVSYANDPITVVLKDLKQGDVVKIDYKGVNGSFYSKGITVVTDGTLSSEVVEKTTVLWNFKENNTDLVPDVDHQSGEEFKIAVQDTPQWTLDAIATGKISLRSQEDLQVNEGAIIKVPVRAKGDVITIVANGNYYSYTIGSDSKKADSVTFVYGVTDADVAAGYAAITFASRQDGDQSKQDSYLYSIQLVTTGEAPEPPAAKNTYGFDFMSTLEEADINGTTKDISSTTSPESGEGTLTIDATSGKIGYEAGAYTNYGFHVYDNAKFKFTLEGDGDIDTDVTIANTYTGTATANVYAASDAEMSQALNSEPITIGSKETKKISFTAKAGEYVVVLTATNSFYTKGINIATTGTLKLNKPKQTITWNLNPKDGSNTLLNGVQGNGYNMGYVSNNENVSLSVTLNNGGKFAPNGSNWMQISDATIKVPVYAAGDIVTVHVYQNTVVTATNGIESKNPGSDEGEYEFTAENPGYMELKFGVSTGYYVNKITLTTTGEIPAPEFVFKKVVYNNDKNTAYVIGEIAKDALADAIKVGINAAKSEIGALADDASELETDTVYSSVVDEASAINEEADDDKYIAAIKIPGLSSDDKFYVSAYSEIGGHKVYDTVHEETVAQQ